MIEPIRFFGSADLLGGKHPQDLPANAVIVRDLDQAMMLENEQDLPPGYLIWRDQIEQALAEFVTTPQADEAAERIEAAALQQWQAMGEFERELKKKKLRKTITLAEEFWLTVAYDILETLKSVALSRHATGGVPLFEDIFAVFKAGFYPCGLTQDRRIVAFDPRVLVGK